jgi:NUMOD4 motif-containing protein/HNH endonuclease
MVEEWRPIDGYDSYEVSNLGRVRSLVRSRTMLRNGVTVCVRYPAKILKLHLHSNGYLSVHLYPGGRRCLVNRLVCAAFNGPPLTPDHHADHENTIRDDNRANNLRWLSPEANRALRKTANGARSNKSDLTDDIVRQIRAKTGIVSDKNLAAQYGVVRETISKIRHRKTWKHIPEGTSA